MSVVTNVLAETGGFDHMNGWGGGWMWLWGVVMMTLFVVLVLWLVRASDAGSTHPAPAPPDPVGGAERILAERYAEGDLSTDEYRERISELQ